MRTLFRSEFLRRFTGGFALGAVALMLLQPASATGAMLERLIG